jgi:di/tricarboxylate transporter
MKIKRKLCQLTKRSRWKMIIFAVVIDALLFWQSAIDYYYYLNFNFLFARRAFFKHTRQRAHWVGSQIAKPHRLAFSALAIIVLSGIFIAPQLRAALYWSIGWGSVFSVYVISQSLLRIQRSMTRVMFK